MLARMEMMKITTINSTRLKPARRPVRFTPARSGATSILSWTGVTQIYSTIPQQLL